MPQERHRLHRFRGGYWSIARPPEWIPCWPGPGATAWGERFGYPRSCAVWGCRGRGLLRTKHRAGPGVFFVCREHERIGGA